MTEIEFIFFLFHSSPQCFTLVESWNPSMILQGHAAADPWAECCLPRPQVSPTELLSSLSVPSLYCCKVLLFHQCRTLQLLLNKAPDGPCVHSDKVPLNGSPIIKHHYLPPVWCHLQAQEHTLSLFSRNPCSTPLVTNLPI